MLQVSATLSILLTWMEGCAALEEPEAPAPIEPDAPEALPDAPDPVLLDPLADGLLELLADGLLAELVSELPLAPPALVTVPETATSCPMWEFSLEVSALAGMIR